MKSGDALGSMGGLHTLGGIGYTVGVTQNGEATLPQWDLAMFPGGFQVDSPGPGQGARGNGFRFSLHEDRWEGMPGRYQAQFARLQIQKTDQAGNEGIGPGLANQIIQDLENGLPGNLQSQAQAQGGADSGHQ